MRVVELFDRSVSQCAQALFLRNEAQSITYGWAQQKSYQIARALLESGLEPGTVVGTFTPNDIRVILIVLGIWRAGMTWLPINHRYQKSELTHSIEANHCKALFYHSSLNNLLHGSPATHHIQLIAINELTTIAPSFDDWIGSYSTELLEPEVAPAEIAAIRSTGGTTGLSKGVMWSDDNYTAVFSALLTTVNLGPNPVHLAAAPLSHAAGTLCLLMAAVGGQNVIMNEFNPSEVLRTIERLGVTHMFLTPTMIYMMLDDDDLGLHDYSSLRHIIYSGAPMSVEKLKRAIDAFGPVMMQAFGQAECPFFCTILTPQDHMDALNSCDDTTLWSCGRATPFVRVEIMDKTGNLLSAGEKGEIVVRGDLVMKGYYSNPDATMNVSRFNWHHTGDIGYKDANGFLYIVDRERDIIISGGFNIFPSEIERVIWSHPAVKDCAVIGVPDEKWGEAVVAIVELRTQKVDRCNTEAEQILQLCRHKLGGMKVPKRIEFRKTLPRSTVGKVLKREIRDEFWKAHSRAV